MNSALFAFLMMTAGPAAGPDDQTSTFCSGTPGGNWATAMELTFYRIAICTPAPNSDICREAERQEAFAWAEYVACIMPD